MAVKVVIVKKPSLNEMSSAENDAANKWAWDNYGRTTTSSLDDLLAMLRAGNTESYAVIAYPQKPSQIEAMKQLVENGFPYITILNGATSPLPGLALGHIFAYRYSLTSPFNAPRDYGLHEGADYDIVGGVVNNTAQVLCAYPGVVDRNLDSPGAYGKYVRVKHERNGSIFYTRYCHLDNRTAPPVGQSIAQGANIGEVGTTGTVTGEHVHFNIEAPGYGLSGYVVADVVNPEPYMAPGRNLLPLIPTAQIDVMSFMKGDPVAWRVVRLDNGSQEDVRDKELGNGLYVRAKGSNGEWWRYDANYAYLVHDTSPDVDSHGNARCYTIYKNGVAGASPKNPRYMVLNQEWNESGLHRVQFKSKVDCRPLPENSGEALNRATLVRRALNHTFNRYGQNLTLSEVIWIQTGVETQIYAKHNGRVVGWCGWSAPWGECEITELYWDRGVLPNEPNRYCNW